MFRVENADFIADKLATELLPNQEFREVLKNALEAVERRINADGSKGGGRIEFDVDWSLYAQSDRWYICCADNGDGMGKSQLEKYTTTLAVQGAGLSQSIRGNQGMGLKISGPTRHKKGVLIRSWKGKEKTMVQVGWDGREYGFIPVGSNDELVISQATTNFPKFIRDQQSGTVVTFLGNTDGDNTFVPRGNARGWLLRYLNTRFFRLSTGKVEVVVRVPSGDEDEWPRSPEEAAERMKGRGKSFNLTRVNGTAHIWDDAADRQGKDWRGVVSLPGDAPNEIPPADVHWWVLPPEGSGTDVSSRTASGGSLAVLFQNELHDWRTSNQANPFFARLGVLFGKTRIAFVIEPKGTTITSDFARAHVLVSGTPLFETDAWLVWAEQFRAAMPQRIRQTMDDEQARLETEDPDRVKRIRDRLRDVMQLLRPRRFRRAQQGSASATAEVLGAGPGTGPVFEAPLGTYDVKGSAGAGKGRTRGIGALLSQVDEQAGQPATETTAMLNLEPRWVTEQESEGLPVVKGNGNGLRDRAAALAGTDGRTANMLLLNKDFRGYQAILAAVNDWANAEGDDDKSAKIEAVTREWVEQKMIEAVLGLRQLENGKTWLTEHYDEAFSPVALTGAFMADRYHTLAEVKRAAGSLKSSRRATASSDQV